MSESPIISPELYRRHEDDLHDGNNLFQCNRCGHLAGDPRERHFLGLCPACDTLVRFYRLIE